MLDWLWKPSSKNKFSLDNLKYLYGQLVKNPVVTDSNKTQIVEVLRTIAELMIWGDQHNANFFDFFCEKRILSHFIRILGQKCDKRVKTQVIQTLSILIQNTNSQSAVFYLLSNNYVNDLIVHRFDFSDEELLAYYISFLKTLSLKLNPLTIQFFFNQNANDFPLYTEAIKFFNHSEPMVRTAVRNLTLNVYRVDDESMRRFILDRSAVPYFSNLVWFLRDECFKLQEVIYRSTYLNRGRMDEFVEGNQIDLYYYLQDILELGIEGMSHALSDQLLSHFVLPVLIGSLIPQPHHSAAMTATATATATGASGAVVLAPAAKPVSTPGLVRPHLALYLLSQVFIIFRHYPFVNSVACSLLEHNPSLLVHQLITTPPQYPVKADLPLTSVLFPPSATFYTELAERERKSKPQPPPKRTNAAAAAAAATATATAAASAIKTVDPMKALAATSTAAAVATAAAPAAAPATPSVASNPVNPASPSPLTTSSAPATTTSAASPPAASPAPHVVGAVSPPVADPTREAYNKLTDAKLAAVAATSPIHSGAGPTAALSPAKPITGATTPVSPPAISTSSGTVLSPDGKTRIRDDIPKDENLKARSAVPELINVSSPIKAQSAYNERAETNIYRTAFFNCLQSNDERLVFGALGVIFTIVKNEKLDREVLLRIGLCPASHIKARRLFTELTGDSPHPAAAGATSVHPRSTSIDRKSDAKDGGADSKSALSQGDDAEYETDSDSEEYKSPASTVAADAAAGANDNAAAVRRSLMDSFGDGGSSVGASAAGGSDDPKQREDSVGAGGGGRSHSHSFSSQGGAISRNSQSVSQSGIGKGDFDTDNHSTNGSTDAALFDAMDADVRELERGKFADEPIATVTATTTTPPPPAAAPAPAPAAASTSGAPKVPALNATPVAGAGDMSPAMGASPRQSSDPLLQRSPVTYVSAPTTTPATAGPTATLAAEAPTPTADMKTLPDAAILTTTAAPAGELKSSPSTAVASVASTAAGSSGEVKPKAKRRRKSGAPFVPEYSEEVVAILLSLLRKQNFRLVTLQLVIELIIEMVLANRPTASMLSGPVAAADAAVAAAAAAAASLVADNSATSHATSSVGLAAAAAAAAASPQPALGSVPETGIPPQLSGTSAAAVVAPAPAAVVPNPALTRAHLEKLEDAIRLSARVMRSRLHDNSAPPSAPLPASGVAPPSSGSAAPNLLSSSTPSATSSSLGNLALDMFEDEYHALARAEVRAERMIANSINLLPIESSALSGLPVNYRLPSGDVEQTRTAIQMFLLLRQLKFKLLRAPDVEFQRIFADDPPIKRNDTIPINNQDLMTCSALVGKRKVRFYLMIESSLSLLMLVQRHPTKAGFAIVQMVVPLRHQEAFLNRSNACVLHITIRCDTAPHASCRKLKGGTTVTTTAVGQPTGAMGATGAASSVLIGKPLWNLALLFEDRVPCHAAKAQLTEARLRLRREMIRTVIASLEPPHAVSANATAAAPAAASPAATAAPTAAPTAAGVTSSPVQVAAAPVTAPVDSPAIACSPVAQPAPAVPVPSDARAVAPVTSAATAVGESTSSAAATDPAAAAATAGVAATVPADAATGGGAGAAPEATPERVPTDAL